MTPYYQDDYCTIYHGDCRDILPSLPKVDLVLTDPPYGINGASGNVNVLRGKANYSGVFADTPEYIETVVIPIISLCIKKATGVAVTTGIRCLHLYPPCDSFGCFYQPSATGMQVFGFVDSQPILYYGRNPTLKNMGKRLSHLMVHVDRNTDHPCPKPIQEWKKIMANCSLEQQTILDPFMGSGTTLRAAKDLRRKCIGIEIEEKYCEIAVKRLRQEVLAL